MSLFNTSAVRGGALALAWTFWAAAAVASALPSRAALDAKVADAMAATGAKSLAVAVIDDGRVVSTTAYGPKGASGAPLTTDTVMYGASLTKAVFGYLVLQLVDEGRLDLDTPIARDLPKPLPAYDDEDTAKRYGRWSDLAGDERWRRITPRMLLNHASGLANLAFLEPDGKLRLHFDPGSRYAYSGQGLLLLQFVLEKGLGLDIAKEAQRRIFDPFGMTNTSLIWREDFAGHVAGGWNAKGEVAGHDPRSKVRVAGSMDTTIADMARFAAAAVRGQGLSPRGRRELTRPQLAITTASQFPTLQPELPPAQRRKDLAVGTAVITFMGPQGPGFMKGGHDDYTGNTMVCVNRARRCVVILGADVRIEAAFPELVRLILGETGAPWDWEYGDLAFWRPARG